MLAKLKHPLFLLFVLGASTLLETLCNTNFVLERTPEVFKAASIPYFLLGIAISLIPLIQPNKQSLKLSLPKLAKIPIAAVKWGAGFFMIYKLIETGLMIFKNFPIDYRKADMLAVLEAQAQRFLNGEEIYAIIPEIWGGIRPIYFPAFWGAFAPFEAIGVDIRWGTLLVLSASIIFILLLNSEGKQKANLLSLLPLIPLYFLMKSIWLEQTFILRFTEEGLSIFYYVLLGIAMWKRWPWLEGLTIGLCLLSRYSFIPWLPVYALFVWIFRNRKDVFLIFGIGGAMFLFLFILPFGIERWEFFLTHPGEYQAYAEKLWTKDLAFFQHTLGLAKFFNIDFVPIQHRLHILSVFLFPAIMLGGLIWKRKKIAGSQADLFFGLCSLKIALVMFYNLVVVPVYYLFWVNSVFSVVILACYVQKMLRENQKG